MSNSGDSSKTIALLAVIIVATVALLGMEAWNRTHKGQQGATVQVAGVEEKAPEVVQKPRRERANGPDRGVRDAHGEVMYNQ